MPRLRRDVQDSSGDVPGPLRSRLDPLWQDEQRVARFRELHDLGRAVYLGPLAAFRACAEAYAIGRGWYRQYGENPHKYADEERMRTAGIPAFGCTAELGELHPEIAGGSEITDEEWPHIADAERRAISLGQK